MAVAAVTERHLRYTAPAIRYPVRRSRWVLYGLCIQAIAVLVLWAVWLWHMRTVWDTMQLAWAWLLPAWVLMVWWVGVRQWRNTPQGMLQWASMQWRFEPVASKAPSMLLSDMKVAWDLQSALLLRARSRPVWRGTVWFWLWRHDDPVAWQALRRAVYSG